MLLGLYRLCPTPGRRSCADAHLRSLYHRHRFPAAHRTPAFDLPFINYSVPTGGQFDGNDRDCLFKFDIALRTLKVGTPHSALYSE